MSVIAPLVQPNMGDDLAVYLEAEYGQGTVFVGWMPESPAIAIVLFELAGQKPERTQDGLAAAVLNPELQIIVRGEPNDYQHTRAMAQGVHDYLGLVSNMQIGANFYLGLLPMRAPEYLTRDILLRAEFEINFAVSMRRPPIL